jgi:FkbM family methyltransferase
MFNIISEMRGLRKEVAELKNILRVLESRSVPPFGNTMPDGSIFVTTIHGQHYFIDASDLIITPHIMVYRQWEADLSAFIKQNVTRDTMFVDVGANFGYFTCLAGSTIGNTGSGRVIAIEPNGDLVGLIRKNIAINWSSAPTTVHEAAANADGQPVHLFVPADRGSNASLSRFEATDECVAVNAVRVDDACAGLTVDLMKVDVEGHEYGVLQGARETILRSPDIKIIMEWSMPQMDVVGINLDEFLSYIRELGLLPYQVHDVDYSQSNAMDWNALKNTYYMNVIFTRPR